MSKDPRKMTHEEVAALPEREVTIDQFLKICRRLGSGPAREHLEKLEHGTFLGCYSADQGVTYKRLHLKRIWFAKFEMNYRTTKTKNGKGRKTDELLIAPFPLPKRITR